MKGAASAMLDIFVYLVSAILKVWHLVLRHVMDDSAAWLVSIALLVLTVRGLLVPLYWASLKSARISVLMRPEAEALDQQVKEAETVEAAKSALVARRELNERYGYNAAAGCLPMLFMLPILIGLYQLLIRMARPEASGQIGLLTAQEVADFQAATWGGMPVQAFVAMPQSWADNMNVSPAQVQEFIMPWLIAAVAMVVANMIFSVWRSFFTTQFDKAFPRRMFYFLIIMVVVAPASLWWIALYGPLPVAIIYYWLWSNGFTLAQSLIIEVFLNRRYPLQELHHNFRREGRQRHRSGAAKAEAKAKKLAKRNMTPEERQAAAEAQRERAAAQSQARTELNQDKAERFNEWTKEVVRRRQERKDKKKQSAQQEPTDATDSDSSSSDSSTPDSPARPD